MILAPAGSAAELEALAREYAGVEERLASAQWEDLKSGLSANMTQADFWTRPDRHATLSRLALMDRVKAAATTAEALRARLAKGTQRTGKSSRELVARLALQLHLLKEGIRDAVEAAPIEVALRVEPALEKPSEHQATRGWCQQLIGMYRAWAGNRHMQLAELTDGTEHNLPWLLISGFGAHRLLVQEIGLHILETDDESGSSRVAARVRLAVAPLGDLQAGRLRSALAEAFGRGPQPHAVVRRYRSQPSPLVRNMNGSWRTGRLDAVLRGDFDLIAASQS
jgi:ATP-dependent Clp protease ATP-binding subunit ClpC